MALTVQQMMLRMVQRIDPRTKRGQVFQDNSAGISITDATNATPIVITAATHGLNTNDQVYIKDVGGNTAANNSATNPHWSVTRLTANTFSLQDDNGNNIAGNGAYTTGGTMIGALVGSVDGNFTRQRQLDIYNEARYAIFGVLEKVMTKESLTKAINGNVVTNSNFGTFSSGTVSKPSGYVRPIYLTDSNNIEIPIIPVTLVTPMIGLQTTTNRFVSEQGTTLTNPSGTTYISDGSGYKIAYYGITTYTLAQVLAGTVTEEFIEDYYFMLLEITEAIANAQGMVDVNSLAKKLLGAN